MYKLVIIVCFSALLTFRLGAQQKTNDSIRKVVQLQEVNITDESGGRDQSFNFYRTNKLANTDEILSRMQSVNLIRRGAYGSEPIIRNYGTGQTNVTIDGMRIYGACTDKMDPVSIYVEPINLQSIQVSQGAAGALNGSTIGGQVNLNFKEPEFAEGKKIRGQLAQSFASVNKGSNTSLSLQQSIGKFAYRVSGVYRSAEDYRSGADSIVKNSGYQKSNASAALVYKIDSTQLLKAHFLIDRGKNIGYPALPMDVGYANAEIVSIGHQKQFRKTAFKTNEFKAYYNSIEHQMDDTHRPESPMHMDMPGWSSTLGAFNEITLRNALQIRVDVHRAHSKADMTMYPDAEPQMYVQTLPENNLLDAGFSIRHRFILKKEQVLGASARIDLFYQTALPGPGAEQWKVFYTDITRIKTDLLKNLNLNYGKFLGEISFLQVSFGYGERIPTNNERYGFYLYNRQDQYDYLGNIDLRPERSFQTELQFKQTFKKVEYSLNVFYHHTKDYVYSYVMEGYSQMTIGAYGLKSYHNIDYAISKGIEGNARANLSDELSYMASVKYVFAQTHQGIPLPLVPPFKLQHAIRYNIRLFQVQVEHDYAMRQSRVNPDYGDRITPSYNLLNIRVSRNFKINSGILQAGIACENVLDADYREHLDIGNIPRFGRGFLVNLSFLF